MHLETQKLTIPVEMPSQPGEYNLTLSFFGTKGRETGQKLQFNFTVASPEDSSL